MADVLRLGVEHGQAIEVHLAGVQVLGIVKTSGGSPWLAPMPGNSNAAITTLLRGAGLEHGMDVPATVQLTSSTPNPRVTRVTSVPRIHLHAEHVQTGWRVFRIEVKDAVRHVLDYNTGFRRRALPTVARRPRI